MEEVRHPVMREVLQATKEVLHQEVHQASAGAALLHPAGHRSAAVVAEDSAEAVQEAQVAASAEAAVHQEDNINKNNTQP